MNYQQTFTQLTSDESSPVHKIANSVSLLAVAPSFDTSKLDDSRRLKAGTGTVIELPFQAHPMPSAVWKFKNGDLPDRKRFKEDTKPGMTSLSMSRVNSLPLCCVMSDK